LPIVVGNATRYGKRAHVGVSMRDHAIDIIVDDDGPGIGTSRRE
jgi:two-component system osmolarity sensor histidine kinase EnvZ